MHRAVRRAAATLVLTTLMSGCATGPDSPPAGVDGLSVPTPSADPGDFVPMVDHPWLALDRGGSVTLSGPGGDLVVTVGERPVEVGGVATTQVMLGAESWLLAQDADGNVWRFVEGARPGLFLPATPRYGDGYRTAYDPGSFEERAEVTALEGDTVEISTTDPVRPGADTVATYEKGVGLVRLESAAGAFER